MKTIIVITFLIITRLTQAQSNSQIAYRIMNAMPDTINKYVKYDAQQKKLEINGMVVPVTGNVVIKQEKDKDGKRFVAFYFQKGFCAYKANDTTYKRAYYRLDVKGSDGAKEVIALYNKLL